MLNYSDYLMVISLPDAIKNEISRYKRASVNVIGHFEGMRSTPHIIVTHQTRCKPFLVHPAIEKMGSRISTIPPIELRINGFGYFNHGSRARTIYALVENTKQTDNWFKLLKKQMDIKVKNFVPHIVIAGNIPVTAFNKLWPNLVSRSFSEGFTANSLTILERDTYAEYHEYRQYKELFFANRLKEIF